VGTVDESVTGSVNLFSGEVRGAKASVDPSQRDAARENTLFAAEPFIN
jgi:hypothetical protein